MSDTDTHGPCFIADHPRVFKEDDDPLVKLASEIEVWLDDERVHLANDKTATLDGGRIVGIYGGRGTGKTSLLLTLYKRLVERAYKDPAAFSLPAEPRKDVPLRDVLFAPADGRVHDDTLFLLLKHLESSYDLASVTKALQSAREAETRRRDVGRFLEYQKEVAASSRDIPDLFVEVRSRVATTGVELREAFRKIVLSLKGGPDGRRPVVLFVDDIDLQPQRALELLEVLYQFLNVPGVVVFFAADKDLLLHNIDIEVERRGLKQPGLPSALLAKMVAHEFALPVLGPTNRVRMLKSLPTKLGTDCEELPHWFPVTGAWVSLLNQAQADRARHEHDDDTRGQRRQDAPEPKDAAGWTTELLGLALPAAHRGLITAHNRLRAERLRHVRDGQRAQRSLILELEREYGQLKVAHEFVAQFVAMLLAADVRRPELGLLDAALLEPAALLEAFSEVNRRGRTDHGNKTAARADERLAQAAERVAGALERPPEPPELPVLDRLRSPHLRGRALGQADRLVKHLADIWALVNAASASLYLRDRLLVVSSSNDAARMATARWDLYDATRCWHVDVRAHGDRQAEALRAARMDARQQLLALDVPSYQGTLELHIKVKLSLAIWLGWELRYLRKITAGNLFGAEIRLFPGPEEPIRFDDRPRFERLRLEPEWDAGQAADADAIVLVDLLGRTQPADLQAFVGDHGNVVTPLAFRLLPASSRRIEPEDVVPILTDVIELLGRLQERGVQRFHLGFVGPDVVAFFLGQQLNAWPVWLYEYYNQRYEYVFDLREPE